MTHYGRSQGQRPNLEIARHRWPGREHWYSFTKDVELVAPLSRLTEQADAEGLQQPTNQGINQAGKELGVSHSTLQRLPGRETDKEILGPVKKEEKMFSGIAEHSFRHQDMIHIIIEVSKRKALRILMDDRVAPVKMLFRKTPGNMVKELLIDIKQSLGQMPGLCEQPFVSKSDKSGIDLTNHEVNGRIKALL